MFPDYIEQMYNDKFGTKINMTADVLYKVLRRDDREMHGLNKVAQLTCLYSRGMTMRMKEFVRDGDAMLVEIHFEDNGVKKVLKSCCGILNCEESDKEKSIYETDVEFLILKDPDRDFIDRFISEKSKIAV